MAETVQGINIKFGADTYEFDRSIKGVNQAMKTLDIELKKINASLKLDPKSVDNLRKKVEVINQKIDVQNEKLRLQKKTLEEIAETKGRESKEWINAYNEVEATRLKIQNLENQVKKLNDTISTLPYKQFEKLGKTVSSVGKKIEDTGKSLSKLSVVASGGLTLAAKSAIDFESSFAGVKKTVNEVVDSTGNVVYGFEDLEKEIREMATRLPSSAKEISAVAESAGQLGIQTQYIMDFTEVMINLGEATNLSAEQGATELARFANIVGMSQKDFDRLGSTIVALGNNFATTESEISAMSLRLAGAGSQVGMTESDILALATALSSVGIEAEAGGSAFSKVMVNMQLAVEKGGDSLVDFANVAGMSAEEFQKAFKEDAAGAILSFIDGLSKAEEQGTTAIAILDDMGITEVRMRDALLRAAGASDIFADAIATGSKAWEENTALTKEAEQRYATMKSQMEILGNIINDIGIEIGQVMMPAIEKVIEKAKDFANGFRNMSDSQKNLIVIIGSVITALGPLLIILGKITSTVGGAMESIGSFASKLASFNPAGTITSTAGSVNLLTQAMTLMTSPIGLVIAAITAVIAALVGLYATNEDFRNQVNELMSLLAEGLKPIIDTIVSVLGQVVSALMNALMPAWTALSDILTNHIIPILITLFTWFNDNIVPVIQILIELVGSTLTTVFNVFGIAVEFVSGLISALFDGISALWKAFAETEFVKTLTGLFEGFLKVIDAVYNAIKNVIDMIGQAASAVGDFMGSVGGFFGGLFGSGGFGIDVPDVDVPIASGGIGTMPINTTINVNNNGRPMTDADARNFAQRITNIVSYELGRRLS